MKRAALFCILLFTASFAQDDYESWQKKEQEKLKKYISEEDSKFSDFLKQQWKPQEIKEGAKPFEKPKPKLPPLVPSVKEDANRKFSVEKAPTGDVTTKPGGKENDIQFNLPIPKKHIHKLEFFSLLLPVTYTADLAVALNTQIDNESIAEYWKNISAANFKECLDQSLALSAKMKLNDWGYTKLLFETGKLINKNRINESYLFTWFMLIKSGYKAKVGYENSRVYLLIPSNNKLYGVPFFSFKSAEQKYYILNLENTNNNADQIYTYNQDYPGTDKIFSFSFRELPDMGVQYQERNIIYINSGREYKIPFRYNTGLIKYLENYPYTDLQVYFSSTLSAAAEGQLISALKSVTDSLSETDALNFLLGFVQYATDYKVDNDQFGYEKPLFPEESLYYKYSDCEDRSIFFSYIVRKVLGLKVVGLDYPDHIATAVLLNSPHDGDAVSVKDKKYLICDPTYIGASIGTAMPVYKSITPGIIESF